MASDDLSLGKAFAVLLGVSAPVIIYYGAYRTGLLARGWRRLRVLTLGGVTTLQRKLSYNCAICQDSMDAMEEVRTLSCNHVFHCRETDKCRDVIDKWLRTQPIMFCPVCRKTPRAVLPWKAPPPASPAPGGVGEPRAAGVVVVAVGGHGVVAVVAGFGGSTAAAVAVDVLHGA